MFGKIKRKKKLQKFSPKNYRVRKEKKFNSSRVFFGG